MVPEPRHSPEPETTQTDRHVGTGGGERSRGERGGSVRRRQPATGLPDLQSEADGPPEITLETSDTSTPANTHRLEGGTDEKERRSRKRRNRRELGLCLCLILTRSLTAAIRTQCDHYFLAKSLGHEWMLMLYSHRCRPIILTRIS